jgi:hypothetical protein
MNGNLYAMITSKSSRYYTDLALSSFLKNTRLSANDEFVLIDNDSEDTYEYDNTIKNLIPKSFAANCNQLIDLANGRNLVLVSNDIIFTPDWNLPLTQYSSALTLPSCNQTHLYTLGSLQLQPTMQLSSYENKSRELEQIAVYHRSQVFGLFERLLMAFYAFSLPVSVYNRVGYFDENFGLGGGEDVDYRLRAVEQDIPVKYLSQSYLLHFSGKSTWDGPEKQREIEERNQKYFSKFADKWGEDLANLCLVGGNPGPVIEKYQLGNFISNRDFNKAFKVVLNTAHRN